MLSIIAFITILIIVLLLLSGRVSPIIALVLVPILGAFVAGFGMTEIGAFFDEGIASVIDVVIMFIFAILFFGILQDVGLFDPLINKLIAVSQGNVIAISVGTVLIAAIAQLDGSGASTFLITIPALLPLYQRLNMNPYFLLLLIGGSASVMNMLPWAGPLGRSASVLGMDVTELWRPLIPIQILGMVLMLGLAVLLGYFEKRRINKHYGLADAATALEPAVQGQTNENTPKAESDNDPSLKRPKLLWLNIIIAVAVIAILVWGIIPSGFAFMIGVSVILPINYPNMKEQMGRIRAHAPDALLMATIILSAGSFLGILQETGMLASLATDIVTILPGFIAPYLHLIIGFFGMPFELLLSTDAYYFALLPVVEQIAAGFDISSLSTTYAMIIGSIVGTFISPFSPALWLALGLANLDMGRHIRYSFFWLWIISIILLGVALLLGVITV